MTEPTYLDPDHELDGLVAEFRRGIYRDLTHALTELERLRLKSLADRRRPWSHHAVVLDDRRITA